MSSFLISFPSSSIHVLICHLNMLIVLFILLTLSFNSAFSAFLIMYLPLGVLMLLFSCTLTGIMLLLRHLNVNCLWFFKVGHFQLNFFPSSQYFNLFFTIFWYHMCMDVSHSVCLYVDQIFSSTEDINGNNISHSGNNICHIASNGLTQQI